MPSETESAVGLGTLMASGLVEIVEGGIVDATAQDDELVLTFEHGETLQVWGPEGLTVSERELVIKDAHRVRWEWDAAHGSAGDRPRLSIEHVRHGAQVEVTQEFLGRYDSRRSQPTRRPAVKIVGF